MRRLKLQMHVSIDGIAAAQRGRAHFNWDEELKQYSIGNLANVDCLLLGRKTAPDFIRHWKSVGDNSNDVDSAFGKLLTGIPKVVFSRSVQKSEWPNATVAKGELAGEVNQLKSLAGKDMLVYGGCGFVESLIEHNLIDEFHLLVNPIALGSGQPIFSSLPNALRLSLIRSRAFSSGTVLLCYEPVRG
jgi:dihydrofolate reductase